MLFFLSCCFSIFRMTRVRKHQVFLYFQMWEIIFSWGTEKFFVGNTVIWFSCTTWWKYCLQDGCMEEDTHNGGLCVTFSLRPLSCRPSVLCLCELCSAGELESSPSLSAVTVACFNWVAAAGLCSQHRAEVLLVARLLFLDVSLHKVKFSKDVQNVQVMQLQKVYFH